MSLEAPSAKPTLITPTEGQRGMTDLHHAAYCNDADEVRALLLKNPNVDARDDNGWTPLHWSIDLAQSGFGEPKLVVSLLLAAGASANATDDSGFSVLMMACGRNNVDILNQLLQAGADVHLRSTHGVTALHEAASCNFVDGIQRLLELGVSLEAVDNWNRTPEALALAYEWNDCAAILKAARQKE